VDSWLANAPQVDIVKKLEMRRNIPKRTSKRSEKKRVLTPSDYLAALPKEKRVALRKLRAVIRSAAPKAEECIGYGLPAFRLNGKFLVAYGAAANHCAFYPGTVVQELASELKGYDVSKGTIRFSADKSLPSGLVRRLVKLRMKKIS
jgi:uncharacterized protein YdhG (YjbR/CyaY superfamily)